MKQTRRKVTKRKRTSQSKHNSTIIGMYVQSTGCKFDHVVPKKDDRKKEMQYAGVISGDGVT